MLYVARTPDGTLQQITAGSLFVTYLIKLNDDEVEHHSEPGKPYSAGDVIEYEQHHASNALECWTDADFERSHVYQVPEPGANIPPGQRIKGYSFEENDGQISAMALLEPIPPPDQVPTHQLMMQLDKIFFLALDCTAYERLMKFLEGKDCPSDVKIYWRHAQVIERKHPKVQFVFLDKWGVSQDWVDQAFFDAAQYS